MVWVRYFQDYGSSKVTVFPRLWYFKGYGVSKVTVFTRLRYFKGYGISKTTVNEPFPLVRERRIPVASCIVTVEYSWAWIRLFVLCSCFQSKWILFKALPYRDTVTISRYSNPELWICFNTVESHLFIRAYRTTAAVFRFLKRNSSSRNFEYGRKNFSLQ